MAIAEGGKDKRDALERRRKAGRTRTLGATFVFGILLGAGLAHLAVMVSRPPDVSADPDTVPPAILAVEPEEGTFLLAGEQTFRIAFSEPLAASPSVALVGPSNFTLTEVSFDGLSWRGELTVTDDADGAYALHVVGMADDRGNRQRDLSFVYEIDTALPTSRASVAANATSEPFDVTWDATDAGSGIASVEVWSRPDEGAWTLLTTSSQDRGTYRMDPGVRKATFDLCALAVDRAGNRESGPATPEATVRYNAVPPSASLTSVDGFWFRNPIDVSATVGPNVTSVDLRYHFAPDNATWQGPFSAGTRTPPLAWTFDFPLGPGHYRLSAQARDAEGTTESEQPPWAAEVAAAYDAEAPIARASPIAPYWHPVAVTVFANATDDRSGIAGVEALYSYRQNGTSVWSPWALAGSKSREPWAFAFDFPRGEGRYALAVRARDLAGNQGTLPAPGDGDVSIGFNHDPPATPLLLPPRYIDPVTRRTNLSWAVTPPPDLVRFEVHRGPTEGFSPDPAPCPTSSTCVAEVGRTARTAWVSLPSENATHWFRLRAVDDGGLTATSASMGANFHGLGYDTPNAYASAAALPVNVAWSERIHYVGGCTDCVDIFRISLDALDVLSLQLAVPATGDFRLVVLDGGFLTVAQSDVRAFGASEALAVEVLRAGVYYVVVDYAGVTFGGRNEGWYTLDAVVAPT